MESNLSKIRRVTIFGAVIDTVLGVAKLIVGKTIGSQSLLADGVHSLSDLATDIFVLVFASYSNKEPDEDHPYGHGKIETLGTTILGSSLISIGILVIYQAVKAILHGDYTVERSIWALILVLATIIGKEFIFRVTKKAAEETKSPMMMANAWHSRSDALSSLIVMIGLVFSYFGLYLVELFAAIFVGIIIARVGWTFVWSSLMELVDTGLTPDKIKIIREQSKSLKAVTGIHEVRSRPINGKVYLDLNVEVGSDMSVTEGHQVALWVSQKVRKHVPEIHDVVVHIDTEYDHYETPDKMDLLPLRESFEKDLFDFLRELKVFDHYKKANYHYTHDNVSVELFFSKFESDTEEVKNNIAAFFDSINLKVTSIDIWTN
ncbi:MAG: cation transporter [Bacteriovoracaceae bacterium]|nr:cation transporter [Bacteriovoracaceae bacterium]